MASGDTLLVFTPLHNEPPTSNYATIDFRNSHPVLDFDGAADESAVFSGVMPRHYAGTTGVTVYLHYTVTSGSGDIDWDIAFERIGDQQHNIDSDGFATALSIDGTTVPTAGLVDVVSKAFTVAEADSIAAGEGFRMKITRDADQDTHTADAELLFVEIKET